MVRRRELGELLLASLVGSAAAARADVPEQHPPFDGRFALTSGEREAGIIPADYSIPPGTPERYGAVGDGIHDDTEALVSAIKCNSALTFSPGRSYAVTTITFPRPRQFVVNFNGGAIRGIAKSPTDCIVKLEMEGSTFIAYNIDLNFNPQYACGTWWYNATASSQYNAFFGMKHSYGVRGLVYGALPGMTSTRFAQSENAIYGFRTRGVQNPFYGNHANGVLCFSQPIFVSHNEEWPKNQAFDWAKARALENHAGAVHVEGGEIQLAATTAGYAADLADCRLVGSIIETSVPIRIIGDEVRISGGRTFMTRDDQSQFYIQPALRGSLRFSQVSFQRSAGLGKHSNKPLVDATGAGAQFEVHLSGTESFDWRWTARGADVRLVQGTPARYVDHRMSITAADPSIYVLNSGAASLLDGKFVDRLGYSTMGWHLSRDVAAARLTATSYPGPEGYLPAQLSLAATGNAAASHVDTANLQSISISALRVRPGETYMITTQIRRSAGASCGIRANFYTLAGQPLSAEIVADSASVSSSWKEIQAPLAIPASAAFLGAAVYSENSTVLWTDFRIHRCS